MARGLGVAPLPPPPKAEFAALKAGPLVVSGFFQDARGVGRAGRLTLEALRRAGLRPVADDLTYVLDPRAPRPSAPRADGGVWLLHCNAPEAAHVLREHVGLAAAPMYRIGYWAWELPQGPPVWLESAPFLHEIWAPSRFTAEAFAEAGVPVRVMPHTLPEASGPIAPAAPRRDGRTTFITFADLRSTLARKNPIGAIEAYRLAFPVPEGSELIVKLSGVKADPQAFGRIRAVAGGRPDIRLVAEVLAEEAFAALAASADVVVSLHRAEGFGLVLAEAMAAGKAVVATGWSGNLDFMAGDCAEQLVPYARVPVGDRVRFYAGGGFWAEPRIDAAAALIRALADDPARRARLGRLNQAAVARLAGSWTAERLLASPFARWIERDASTLDVGGVLQ